MSGKPFVMNVAPVLPVHEYKPREAAIYLVHALKESHLKPHVVFDAAFGCDDVISQCQDYGIHVTASMNSHHNKHFWDWMKFDLGTKEGRVLKKKNGVFASIFNDTKFHCVYTTNVQVEDETIPKQSEDSEWSVSSILGRKKDKNGSCRYHVLWSTNEKTWENFDCFVFPSINQPFLEFINQRDLDIGLGKWNVAKLQRCCKENGWSKCMSQF